MDLSHIIGGNVNCIATLEIPLAGFFACFKIEYTSTMQARNHTYGYLPAMNWMFVTPQNSYTEISIPKVRTLGGGAFGRWLSHESSSIHGVFMNGISRYFFHHVGTLRRPSSMNQEAALTRCWICPVHLDFSAFRTVRNQYPLFISHLYMTTMHV